MILRQKLCVLRIGAAVTLCCAPLHSYRQVQKRVASRRQPVKSALADVDSVAIISIDEARRPKQICLRQSTLRHLLRVIGKAKMRLDSIEIANTT